MLETIKNLVALAVLLAATTAAAEAPIVAIDQLKPWSEHRRATRLITHVIANYHYKHAVLDDNLSREILIRYIDSLDPIRSYFLRADIDEFNRHATLVDDYLRSSNLTPLFDIFVRYRQRVRERVEFAISQLDQKYDFTRSETINFNRKDLPWPTSKQQLDEIWRKRAKNDVLSLRLAGKELDEIRDTLRKRYTGLFRRTAQLNSEDVFQTFINAYTTASDPHTAYFSPRTSENFKIRMSLSLEGIGAVLQNENELTLVREIVPGGPADSGGKLHADDRIVGIGQDEKGPIVDVIGWRLDDVVDLIRGPKDSIVRLQILPKGVGLDGPLNVVVLTRNTIKLEDQAAQSSILELPTLESIAKIGVIDVPTFYMDFEARSAGDEDYRSTTRDVRRLIAELTADRATGIVIDLRGNGGGSLSEATELTGLFIDSGPIVQVRDSQGRVQLERDPNRGITYDGPLLVLVDRNSASASEIFASAIQDYRRGLVVGEPTFGKGTVQNLVDLNRFDQSMDGKLGQLKATIAQFFRVAGGSTQYRGVLPDIIFPTVISIEDHGERALDNALPWARINAANFKPVNLAPGALDDVRRLHEERVLEDSALQAIISIERAITNARNKKELSLVEAVRKQEYETARREQRQRENQIRIARGFKPLPENSAEEEEEDRSARNDEENGKLDVILSEAASILRDWIAAQTPDKRLVHTEQALLDAKAPGVSPIDRVRSASGRVD